MIIKSSEQKNDILILSPIRRAVGNPRRSLVFIFLFGMISFAAVSLASIYYGMVLFKTKAAASFSEFFENAVQTKLRIVPNFIKGQLSAKPERLTIDIKHEDFQRLAYSRELALQRRILMTTDDDFVPAKVRYQDKTYDVKMRLKGDWVDHLLGDKWSFRIVLKGDATIFGMKQFSIHQPKTRNYIYEWIYHQTLRRENILSLRYDFIEVTLNGKDLGVYALEEHFEKRVIEHNRFREGPILKFNEELLWADRAEHYRFGDLSPTGLQAERVGNIYAFKLGRIMGDAGLYSQFMLANNLLDSFRYKKLPAHKVFDIDKLATFFAIADLLGSTHSAVWHNLRFYYNPITSLLEPIGFDANAGHPTAQVLGSSRDLEGETDPFKFKDIAFSDMMLFEAYIKALQKVSAPSYLDSLFHDIDAEMEQKLSIIYMGEPHFYFTKKVFYDNQETIRLTLHPAKGLHAYCGAATNDYLALELGNIQVMPIEVLSASFKDAIFFAPKERVILPPLRPAAPVDYRRFDFACPQGFVWSDTMRASLKINYRVLGAEEKRQDAIFEWPRHTENFLENDFMWQDANARQFAFLAFDDSTRRIFIKPGSWSIDRNLIIPRGYRVICGEGTRLNLSNGALILSYSALEWRGSEEFPIVIESKDSTGQGLAVLNAHAASVFEHVKFDNLSNPEQKGWKLTGAVTFYESPINTVNTQFIGNRCEDGVNVFRSDFHFDKTLFQNTKSDAFDADFSNGKFTNSSFINCGNDGLDVSGSVVELRHVYINGTGDKGVSGGEFSHVQADNIEIHHAEIAVASKDKTELNINNVKIDSCGVGFTAYRKKPEFGAASIIAKHVQMGRCKAPFLIENNSSMKLDGKVIATEHDHVESLFYGNEFGKDTKTGRTAQKTN
jgi:hypothetical protein